MKRVRTSKYRGVNYRSNRGKWVATIVVDGVQKYIGIFNTEIEAALAYNNAAIRYFKDEAKLNECTSINSGLE